MWIENKLKPAETSADFLGSKLKGRREKRKVVTRGNKKRS